MSTIGLFAIGTVVTLIAAFALGLCLWGAVLDGRDEHDRRTADEGERNPLHPASVLAPSTVRTVKPAA